MPIPLAVLGVTALGALFLGGCGGVSVKPHKPQGGGEGREGGEAPISGTQYHPPGFLDPNASCFHGEALAQNKWEMSKCQTCHGKDYRGGMVTDRFGPSVKSCIQCHEESPEGCTTCHGQGDNPAPPRSLRWKGSLGEAGATAHQSHLSENILSDPFPCETCHTVPEKFSPTHISGQPEVTFGGLATYNGYSPVWDRETASCSSVYCHLEATPTWTKVDDGSQMTCASCHPRHSHGIVNTSCSTCHPKVVDNTKTIINRSLHVDGQVQVGPEGVAPNTLTCKSCHDTEAYPLHQAHLGTKLMTPPLTCEECHRVPDSLFAAGHIDDPPPAEVLFPPDGRASLNGSKSKWDRGTGLCSNTSCHPSTSPKWNDSKDSKVATTCILCHGAPPPPPRHPQGIANCSFCHPNTTDGAGKIKPNGYHMNGRPDF